MVSPPSDSLHARRYSLLAGAMLILCLLLRLLTLSSLPLVDPTEGRYASIGQAMELTGNWITPQTYQNSKLIPFLAKPPLHTWATAFSLKLFGMNEFGARFPSFVGGLLTCAFTGFFAFVFFSLEAALFASLILASSLLYFFISGWCLLDPLLMASTTASYFFGALSLRGTAGAKTGGLLFFASLALGFLIKGPVALILVGAGFVPWAYFTGTFRSLWKFPWLVGVPLFLIAAAPWFIVAEKATPGFLNYFFIHENFLRFVVHNYGDKYGSAHTHMYGTSWLMLLGAFFPWTFVLLAGWFTRGQLKLPFKENPWLAFSFFWGIAPALFFMASRQVSFAYLAPGLPGLSLCTAVLLNRISETRQSWVSSILRVMFFSAVVCTIAFIAFAAYSGVDLFSLMPPLLLTALLLMIWNSGRNSSILVQITAASTAIAALFSTLTVGAPYAMKNASSAKEIIGEFEKDARLGQAAFYLKVPQSAYFYFRAESGKIPSFRAVNEKTGYAQEPFLIARKKDARALIGAPESLFTVARELGNYELLEKRTHP